jgi:glutamyl-tRNA reductase
LEAAQNTLLCVGTSYRLAPVSVLERAMHEAELMRCAFERAVRRGESAFPFRELAVLATCNRVECYVACEPAVATHTARLLKSALRTGGPTETYEHRDQEAVRHLCRVAAGLDSLIVGESQVAGQVARAFDAVVHVNGGPPMLQAAAMVARRLSRRARIKTRIARGPASISSVAVHVAAERIGGLADKGVLVLGAGKMGQLACHALRKTRARVTVANRTLSRAENVARRAGAVPVPLYPIAELLAGVDAVIASTASPVPLIGGDTVRRAFELRKHAGGAPDNLLIIDLAVPRNVSEEVGAIEGVQLTGIDDLRARAALQLEERRKEIPRVERMIEHELTLLAPRRTLW